MHSDIHLMLQSERTAELRREAAQYRQAVDHRRAAERLQAIRLAELTVARFGFRAQLGWKMVELGLRLVNRPAVHKTRLA